MNPIPLPFLGLAMILGGFLLDLLLGDPHWAPHPVRAMGFLISRGETILRRLFPAKEGIAGLVLVIIVAGLSFIIPLILLLLAFRFNFYLGFTAGIIMSYQTLAARCLRDESMKVYRRAAAGDLEGARKAVSMIVGRDTGVLSMEGVVKAAVETVAENLSDGVIAPLFFLAIGGPPLALFHKAVNTMDSMIGYKNKRYIHFGRAAAKLDDALNWIPARISARLIILAAGICGLNRKNAALIYRRDKGNHASPNSGHPEAACAGALGLALAGSAYYGGVLEEKPSIGDPLRPVENEDIPRTCKLMYLSTVLFLLPCCIGSLLLGAAIQALLGYIPC